MLIIGDIQVYVSDLERAMRFWSKGLALEVTEHEVIDHEGFARLEFTDGSPAICLLCADAPWEPGTRPAVGTRPTVRFDVATDDFDATLVRLLECGGAQLDEIETYEDARMVTVADPDGNTFDLVEIREADIEDEG